MMLGSAQQGFTHELLYVGTTRNSARQLIMIAFINDGVSAWSEHLASAEVRRWPDV
jgi:hypothetical protein